MENTLSLSEWLLANIIILFAASIQGIIGYGIGVFGVPLLYLLNPDFVPAPMIIVGMLLPLLILIRDHAAVVKQDLKWALPALVIGIAAAGGVINTISQQGVGLFVGAAVLLGIFASVFHRIPAPGSATIGVASGISGFMGTITAIGGPPLALVLQNMDGKRLRATMSAVFVPAGVLALGTLFARGYLSSYDLLLALGLLPGMLAGFALSGAVAPLIPSSFLRPIVLITSAAAAILIIYRSLF